MCQTSVVDSDVKRSLLRVRGAQDDGRWVRVDVIRNHRVRVQVMDHRGERDVLFDTLEEVRAMMAKLDMDADLAEQLAWELDLMGLSGT